MKAAKPLTKSVIDRAQPAAADQYLWDHKVTGLGLRVKPSGVKSLFIQYRNKYGRSRRVTLGQFGKLTLEEARALARKAFAEIAGGGDPRAERDAERDALTLADLVERYRNRPDDQRRPATIYAYDKLINRHILPALGRHKLAAITNGDVRRLFGGLAPTPYLANRTLIVVSLLLNYAIQERLLAVNVAKGIKRWKEHERTNWLRDDDLRRLLDVLNRHPNQVAASALKLIVLTGSRKSEVLGATWSEFDLAHGLWSKPAHRVKQDRIERVPLSASAVQLLTALRAGAKAAESDLLFPSPLQPGKPLAFKRIWDRVRQEAGINCRLHDLRHTFASHLVSSGTSLYTVGRLLGHSKPTTTQRYAHLSSEVLQNATDAFASKVAGLEASPGRLDAAAASTNVEAKARRLWAV